MRRGTPIRGVLGLDDVHKNRDFDGAGADFIGRMCYPNLGTELSVPINVVGSRLRFE